MQTQHQVLEGDARDLAQVADGSVHLVLTSPPYPMIAMWDHVFAALDPRIGQALEDEDGPRAFEAMHQQLDRAWRECHRVLAPGGLACINIGDATRSLAGSFALWPNHARILSGAAQAGFTILPDVLWHKPTNAPNKFMGSGMLPAGAYVTYEHEYVLILRKGDKRAFSRQDAARRRRSAYFWEERNRWFSDLWQGIRGTRQQGVHMDKALRERSAAFPLDLPLRLVAMYSLYEDVVLDPFAGAGTTGLAAAMLGRSSVAVERDAGLGQVARQRLHDACALGRAHARERLAAHQAFVSERQAAGKELRHHNRAHDLPVITRQERELELWVPVELSQGPAGVTLEHRELAADCLEPLGQATLPF